MFKIFTISPHFSPGGCGCRSRGVSAAVAVGDRGDLPGAAAAHLHEVRHDRHPRPQASWPPQPVRLRERNQVILPLVLMFQYWQYLYCMYYCIFFSSIMLVFLKNLDSQQVRCDRKELTEENLLRSNSPGFCTWLLAVFYHYVFFTIFAVLQFNLIHHSMFTLPAS